MCGYRTRLCMKLLPDEFAPQRGEHVCVADAGLLAIPGSLQAALFEVGLGVPAELIPADRDCDREKSEWDGARTAPLTRFWASPTPWFLASWWTVSITQ